MSKAKKPTLVKRERNRATRTIVEVIDNRDGSFEKPVDAESRWVTLCADHETYCLHATWKLAMDHSRDPSGWCDKCNKGAR